MRKKCSIERVRGSEAIFFHVMESYKDQATITNVEFEVHDDKARAIVWQNEKRTEIVFSARIDEAGK